MKERPILFSAPMVQAILAGRKTQTRRIIKPGLRNPGWTRFAWFPQTGMAIECGEDYPDGEEDRRHCPYGKPGDRLWVRESWRACATYDWAKPGLIPLGSPIFYEASRDEWPTDFDSTPSIRARPSIHMPRWASRITLEVTDVRVERLQQISREDAVAEGCDNDPAIESGEREGCLHDPRALFCCMWESIHSPDSWDANPWVWVIAFRRIEQEGKT